MHTGEIDMALDVVKTPEREQLYDFSDEPVGVSVDVIMVSSRESVPCIPGNHFPSNGLKIAVEGSAENPPQQHKSLQRLALDKWFSYEEQILLTHAGRQRLSHP